MLMRVAEAERGIGVVRAGPAGGGPQTARPAARAERAVLAGPFRAQRAGAAEPVQEGGGPHEDPRVRGYRLFHPADLSQELAAAREREPAHPAGHHDPAAEAAPPPPADQTPHPLPLPAAP